MVFRDINVSNIASGFVYHSPANQAVRADAAFDSTLESSFFDYTNITSDGLVSNRVYTLSPSVASPPRCQSYSVLPGFPLLPADVLVSNDAVFAGSEMHAMNGMATKVSHHHFSILIPSLAYQCSVRRRSRYFMLIVLFW